MNTVLPDVDDKVLRKLRDPEPTNHFDERMHWSLADVQEKFPTGKFDVVPPSQRSKA